MRCDEVIRELAVPTDGSAPAILSEHLATCPLCADWAKRAGQLDRLWEMTRPTEPSPEVWDSVWAHVASSLESPVSAKFDVLSLPAMSSNGSLANETGPVELTHSSARARRWKWGAVGLIGLAQAAAVLLVVGLTWQPFDRSAPPAIAQVNVSPVLFPELAAPIKIGGPRSVPVVEIDEGRLVVIHFDGSAANIVDLTPQAATYRLEKRLRNLESALVDDWLLMLNEVESMTKPLVAMKE